MRSRWLAGRGFSESDYCPQRRASAYDCPNLQNDSSYSFLLGGSDSYAGRLCGRYTADLGRLRGGCPDGMLEFLILCIRSLWLYRRLRRALLLRGTLLRR